MGSLSPLLVTCACEWILSLLRLPLMMPHAIYQYACQEIRECLLKDIAKRFQHLRTFLLLHQNGSNISGVPSNLFQQLSRLRVLDALRGSIRAKVFSVGEDRGYHISELKYLNALRGSIKIMQLEYVGNEQEAAEVALHLKSDLRNLSYGRSSPCRYQKLQKLSYVSFSLIVICQNLGCQITVALDFLVRLAVPPAFFKAYICTIAHIAMNCHHSGSFHF